MAAFVRAFLFCDGCGEAFRTDTVPPDHSVSEVRSYARRHGWTLRRSGPRGDNRLRDYCVWCSR